MLAMVLSSVRYAPPILGSETRLKKAPREVNIKVDVKLVASPHAPRAKKPCFMVQQALSTLWKHPHLYFQAWC